MKASNVEQLHGTWKLVSATRRFVATGEESESFGARPSGYLIYTRDGRMFAIVTKDGRPKPSDMSKATDQERIELFNTMLAYAGRFSVDGDKVTHHVDISWNENWTGTKQMRNVRLDGRKLYIRSDPQPSPIDGKQVVGELEWEKLQ